MRYDTSIRQDHPAAASAPATIEAALDVLNIAVLDCVRSCRPLRADAAVQRSIRELADIANRTTPGVHDPCDREPGTPVSAARTRVRFGMMRPPVAPSDMAARNFHHRARAQLARFAEVMDLERDDVCITTVMERDDDGMTELRHPDLSIRVVPRSFLADSEITFNRCRNGEPAGPVQRAPIAALRDAAAFRRRVEAAIGDMHRRLASI